MAINGPTISHLSPAPFQTLRSKCPYLICLFSFRVLQATDGPVCEATDGDSPSRLLPGTLRQSSGDKTLTDASTVSPTRRKQLDPQSPPFPNGDLGHHFFRGKDVRR